MIEPDSWNWNAICSKPKKILDGRLIGVKSGGSLDEPKKNGTWFESLKTQKFFQVPVLEIQSKSEFQNFEDTEPRNELEEVQKRAGKQDEEARIQFLN